MYSESYIYNATTGNLASKATLNYTYGTQASNCPEGALSKPHAAVSYGTNSYCYDQNGNMRRRSVGSTYTLTYDAENHLVQVEWEGNEATFVYDGDGKRVQATFDIDSTETVTTYIGDHFEWSGNTSTMIKYFYANGQRVAMKKGSLIYFLFADHLGSTAITTNDSQAKVGELRYKAWGENRYGSGMTYTQRH